MCIQSAWRRVTPFMSCHSRMTLSFIRCSSNRICRCSSSEKPRRQRAIWRFSSSMMSSYKDFPADVGYNLTARPSVSSASHVMYWDSRSFLTAFEVVPLSTQHIAVKAACPIPGCSQIRVRKINCPRWRWYCQKRTSIKECRHRLNEPTSRNNVLSNAIMTSSHLVAISTLLQYTPCHVDCLYVRAAIFFSPCQRIVILPTRCQAERYVPWQVKENVPVCTARLFRIVRAKKTSWSSLGWCMTFSMNVVLHKAFTRCDSLAFRTAARWKFAFIDIFLRFFRGAARASTATTAATTGSSFEKTTNMTAQIDHSQQNDNGYDYGRNVHIIISISCMTYHRSFRPSALRT